MWFFLLFFLGLPGFAATKLQIDIRCALALVENGQKDEAYSELLRIDASLPPYAAHSVNQLKNALRKSRGSLIEVPHPEAVALRHNVQFANGNFVRAQSNHLELLDGQGKLIRTKRVRKKSDKIYGAIRVEPLDGNRVLVDRRDEIAFVCDANLHCRKVQLGGKRVRYDLLPIADVMKGQMVPTVLVASFERPFEGSVSTQPASVIRMRDATLRPIPDKKNPRGVREITGDFIDLDVIYPGMVGTLFALRSNGVIEEYSTDLKRLSSIDLFKMFEASRFESVTPVGESILVTYWSAGKTPRRVMRMLDASRSPTRYAIFEHREALWKGVHVLPDGTLAVVTESSSAYAVNVYNHNLFKVEALEFPLNGSSIDYTSVACDGTISIFTYDQSPSYLRWVY